jgi:hypothetical protein
MLSLRRAVVIRRPDLQPPDQMRVQVPDSELSHECSTAFNASNEGAKKQTQGCDGRALTRRWWLRHGLTEKLTPDVLPVEDGVGGVLESLEPQLEILEVVEVVLDGLPDQIGARAREALRGAVHVLHQRFG